MPPFRRRGYNPYYARRKAWAARKARRRQRKQTLINPTMRGKVRGLSKEIYHDRHINNTLFTGPTVPLLSLAYSDYWDLNYPYDPDTTLGGETAWNFLTMARKFQTFEVRAVKLTVIVKFAPYNFAATTNAAASGLSVRKNGFLMIGYWSQDEAATTNTPGWYADFAALTAWASGSSSGTWDRWSERAKMVDGYGKQFIAVPWEMVPGRKVVRKFKRYIDFHKEFGWEGGDPNQMGGVEWSGSMTTTILHPDTVARVGVQILTASTLQVGDYEIDVHIKHYTHWTRPNLSYNMELGYNIAV